MTKGDERTYYFRNVIKIMELVFCALLFPRLFKFLSLTSAFWYGIGVAIGLLSGYWLPPRDKDISFGKWFIISLFLAVLGGCLLMLFQS